MTEAEQSRSVAMLSGIEDAMRVNSFAIALEACDRIRPQDIPNLLLAYVETMPKAIVTETDAGAIEPEVKE